MRVALTLLILFFVTCIPAFADQVYDVTGSVTLTGNNFCSGPCIEILDFSFQVTYQTECCGAFLQVVLPGSTTTSTGPLAPFSLLASPDNYFAFFNSTGDEIDIFGPNFGGGPALAPFPRLIGSELYGCVSADTVCIADFVPPGSPTTGHVIPGSLQYTVTAAPEVSTLGYLAAGASALVLLAFRRTRSYLR